MSEKIKFTRFETHVVSIPYRYPWRNKHTEERGEPMTHLDTTIIRMHTDVGIIGLGEARGSDVGRVIREKYEPFLKGRNPMDIERVLSDLQETFGQSRILGGIDFGLHDITGQALNVPVYQLLGGKVRDKVPLIWTVPYRSIEEQVAEVKQRVSEGFTHAVKMKVGVVGDQEHVQAVAEAAGGVPLRPDNNQGHDAETALKQFRALKDNGVAMELVEDPSPSNWDDYQRLSEELSVGISVHAGWKSLQDLGDLIRANKPGIKCVNITFAGWGIRRTMQIAGALECAGIGWSMGTSHESGIKTAAALHVGSAVRNHLYPADILGPMLHEADVLAEPSDMGAGYGVASDKPGLGISLNEDVLEKYAAVE
jgi:L-alanine-DL-glutamate epimerase-like enolase superfamily enzyme